MFVFGWRHGQVLACLAGSAPGSTHPAAGTIHGLGGFASALFRVVFLGATDFLSFGVTRVLEFRYTVAAALRSKVVPAIGGLVHMVLTSLNLPTMFAS